MTIKRYVEMNDIVIFVSQSKRYCGFSTSVILISLVNVKSENLLTSST